MGCCAAAVGAAVAGAVATGLPAAEDCRLALLLVGAVGAAAAVGAAVELYYRCSTCC
jgi:hypothetical protein